jgi:hypothetical protein
MTTTETVVFTDVTIKMRLGVANDFKKEVHQLNAGEQLETKSLPKEGQPYWVKSATTGEFDNRNYQITEDTNWEEFRSWLRQGLVYVPAGYFELNDAGE